MAKQLTGLQITLSGLPSSDVATLEGMFDTYSGLDDPVISANVAFPQQPLVDVDLARFQVIYSRTNPSTEWATKDSDFIASVVNFIAPLTPP